MKNADDVTVAQKLYEKFVMLCANDAQLSITLARRPEMGVEVIVGYQHDDGGFTPLAVLLTKRDIEQMCPIFEAGEKLAAVYRAQRATDLRCHPDEFGKTGRNPAFTDEAIDAMRLDA